MNLVALFQADELAGLDLESAARVVALAVLVDEHGEHAKAMGARMAALVHDEERWKATHASWSAWWTDVTGMSDTTSYRWVERGRDLLGLPQPPKRETPGKRATSDVATPSSHGISNPTGGNLTMVEVIEVEVIYDPPRPDTPKLDAIIGAMRAVNPDVAGTLADEDQYHEVISWCRTFQDAYKHMHRGAEVKPNFKKQ